jgi:hypothetical protein
MKVSFTDSAQRKSIDQYVFFATCMYMCAHACTLEQTGGGGNWSNTAAAAAAAATAAGERGDDTYTRQMADCSKACPLVIAHRVDIQDFDSGNMHQYRDKAMNPNLSLKRPAAASPELMAAC